MVRPVPRAAPGPTPLCRELPGDDDPFAAFDTDGGRAPADASITWTQDAGPLLRSVGHGANGGGFVAAEGLERDGPCGIRRATPAVGAGPDDFCRGGP